jgi:hypothetical protein
MVSALGVVLLVAAAATWARERPAAMPEASSVILRRVEAALEAGRERDQKAHDGAGSGALKGAPAGRGGAGKSTPPASEKIRAEVLGVIKSAAAASRESPVAAERELERARKTEVFANHKAPLDAGSLQSAAGSPTREFVPDRGSPQDHRPLTPTSPHPGSVSISRAERDGRREAQQGGDGEEAARTRAAAAAARDYAKSRQKMMAREMAQVHLLPPATENDEISSNLPSAMCQQFLCP